MKKLMSWLILKLENRLYKISNKKSDVDDFVSGDVIYCFSSLVVYSFIRWIYSYFWVDYELLNLYYLFLVGGLYLGLSFSFNNATILSEGIRFIENFIYPKLLNKFYFCFDKEHLFNLIYCSLLHNDFINIIDFIKNEKKLKKVRDDYLIWVREEREDGLLKTIDEFNALASSKFKDNVIDSLFNSNFIYQHNKFIGFCHSHIKNDSSTSRINFLTNQRKEAQYSSLDYYGKSSAFLTQKIFGRHHKGIVKWFDNFDGVNAIVYARTIPAHFSIDQKFKILRYYFLIMRNLIFFDPMKSKLLSDSEDAILLFQKIYSNTSFYHFENFILSGGNVFDGVEEFSSHSRQFLEKLDPPAITCQRDLEEYQRVLSKLTEATSFKEDPNFNIASTLEWTEELDGIVCGKYRLEILSKHEDFIQWGAKLSHCLGNGGYYTSASRGKSCVLGVLRGGKKYFNVVIDSKGVSSPPRGFENKNRDKEWNSLVLKILENKDSFKKYKYHLLV